MVCSMRREGDCYDNAVIESFWSTLKAECATGIYASRSEARQSIFEYIEVWYNRQRHHSALGYQSPEAFEKSHFESTRESFKSGQSQPRATLFPFLGSQPRRWLSMKSQSAVSPSPGFGGSRV